MLTQALKDSAAKYQRTLMQALVFNLNFECETPVCGVTKQNIKTRISY